MLVFGIVFVLLSAATAVWRWSTGEHVGPEILAPFTGGLVVGAIGLYLMYRQ